MTQTTAEVAAARLSAILGHDVEFDDLVETAESIADFTASRGAPTDARDGYAAWESTRNARRSVEVFVIDGGDRRFVYTVR